MAKTGVTAPLGFRASGVACGIKKNGERDLALVVSDIPATCAGIFTKNVVKGHSLKWTMKAVSRGTARAVAINSGCANACVGEDGDRDAYEMARMVSRLVGCEAEDVLLGSTGVIGYRLDLEKIKNGLQEAFRLLSGDGGNDAARAVMTTDTFPKESSRAYEYGGHTITIGGMAKGSGMIHPDMATMISVITTDANISREMLDRALRDTAEVSYNRISVDGDTSVCDKVLVLANGLAGNPVIESDGPAYDAFLGALKEVAVELAKMLARDGEGATKLIEINVKNAPDKEMAHLVLNAIAKSPLVKTAIHGCDANWGRIITAAGYSGAGFDPEKVDISLGDVLVCKSGMAVPFDEAAALEVLRAPEVVITLDMNQGAVSDRIWTCDLTCDYIRINGSYRT
ncbi:MAG TPA: bifunctional glutamate N-acetyltransferase/amino-acid acetyltransferase ArgJ [Thermoclostridium sp.]|nr:bifunctional glutamate N-acetyltransferase/amino-acid acetyltransferase ArgJ [Clostridiaceae bacterium]HOQ75675.1 bifunctional glutamate N-acetyltransferase/amino-acid acetyltransferase ArgJ [Thermoclostridium sp.]HPU45777.1 bifunctional glutamate N-acetyltransferase/amino-acid acetyltransferase ArgJ [Thermoclostridium sp.]